MGFVYRVKEMADKCSSLEQEL